VLKESFKLYKALSEGLINLADRFFEMDHAHAVRGLEAYREAIAGSNSLQARRARDLWAWAVASRAVISRVNLISFIYTV
jgi:hypothetical protein